MHFPKVCKAANRAQPTQYHPSSTLLVLTLFFGPFASVFLVPGFFSVLFSNLCSGRPSSGTSADLFQNLFPPKLLPKSVHLQSCPVAKKNFASFAFQYDDGCSACASCSLLLQQVAFRTRAAASAFQNFVFRSLGELTNNQELESNLVSQLSSCSASFDCSEAKLDHVSQLCSKRELCLQPSFCFGSLCFSTFPASASKMSLSSAASAASVLGAPPGASAAAASSFTHEEAVMMQLQNEAFALPEALLDHTLKAELCNKNGEAYPKQLPAETFKLAVPKLDKKKLRFWLLLHEEAFQHLKASEWKYLPQQRCSGTNNANLGNFQASSSFSKQVAFYAWIVNRHEKLSGQAAYMVSLDILPESFVWSANFMQLNKTVSLDYRASDTQLCFWGKLDPAESQPSFEKLGVEVGSLVWKLPNFTELSKHLYSTASFDWGASSSEWQLAKNWRTDSLQHAEVYWKLQENLGSASPLGKLIRAHFAEAWKEPPAASPPSASALAASSVAAFWHHEAASSSPKRLKALSSQSCTVITQSCQAECQSSIQKLHPES